jgi:hypothetical protein
MHTFIVRKETSTRFKIPQQYHGVYFKKELAAQRLRRRWINGNRGEIDAADAFECGGHGQSLNLQIGFIETIE